MSSDDKSAATSNAEQAYQNALRAHEEATARHKALKADLDALIVARSKQSAIEDAECKVVAGEYAILLQQRETLRRLQVVSQTFASISKENNPIGQSADDFARTRAGEMPPPPAVQGQHADHTSAKDDRLLELKRAILGAKATVERHHNPASKTNGVASTSIEAEAHALQQARNAMIAWIEDRLSIIGDAQTANTKAYKSPRDSQDDEPIPVSTQEIGQIYEQYTSARRSLLQSLRHPMDVDQLFAKTGNARSPPSVRNADGTSSLSASLLPYIASLTALKEMDSAAMQQTTFATQQLSNGEAETARLLRRLADESHLVQPGVDHGKAWAAASTAASNTVAAQVRSKIKDSTSSLDQAEIALDGMQHLAELR